MKQIPMVIIIDDIENDQVNHIQDQRKNVENVVMIMKKNWKKTIQLCKEIHLKTEAENIVMAMAMMVKMEKDVVRVKKVTDAEEEENVQRDTEDQKNTNIMTEIEIGIDEVDPAKVANIHLRSDHQCLPDCQL